MGDFVSAGKFLKVAFLLAVNAMVLFLFALGTGLGSGFNDDGVDAMIVISILVCIVGVFLTFCVVFVDELGNKIAKIVIGILLVVGGVFIVIGTAIWGGKFDDLNADPLAIPTTLGVFAALMFILGGIFLIVEAAQGGGDGEGAR